MEYPVALERARALQRRDGPEVNGVCRTVLLDHGQRTERAAVLLHGLTNCPAQFAAFGAQLHDRGYNVLIPRLPHHGLADRMNRDQARITASDLKTFAEEAAVIGAGLGERLTVCGLSLGGLLTSWLLQKRPFEVAMPISPVFGVRGLPRLAHRPLAALAVNIPNLYLWWDPRRRESLQPSYGYPRFASRAFGAMLSISRQVQTAALREAPRAQRIVVVTNAHDPGVGVEATALMVERWRRWGSEVHTHQFGDELGLPHDLVDPGNPEQRLDLVYPILLELISRPARGASRPS